MAIIQCACVGLTRPCPHGGACKCNCVCNVKTAALKWLMEYEGGNMNLKEAIEASRLTYDELIHLVLEEDVAEAAHTKAVQHLAWAFHKWLEDHDGTLTPDYTEPQPANPRRENAAWWLEQTLQSLGISRPEP